MTDDLDRDRDVDELVDAADAEARFDLRGAGAPPPFAAIVARAHRIDPSAVGTDAIGAVERPRARKVPRLPEDPIADPTIDAWVAAARAEADYETRQHLSRPRPPMRKPVTSAPRRWALVGGGLLVAAVAMLVIGLRPILSAPVDASDAKSQAVSSQERDDGPLPAAEIADDDRAVRARGAAAAKRPASGDALDAADAAELEPAPLEAISGGGATPPSGVPGAVLPGGAVPGAVPGLALPGAKTPSVTTERGSSPRSRTRSRARAGPPSLVALDGDAQRFLAAGQLDAAERKLAELVRIGGSDRLVEAAYADRFTIAHRQGAGSRARKLWSEYLQRFPRGRFADDARAGLCRALVGDDAKQCWSDYVRDFPTGTYRARADRAIARSDPS